MMTWLEFDRWIVGAGEALGCPGIADYFSAVFLRGGPEAVLYAHARNATWFRRWGTPAARQLRLFARMIAREAHREQLATWDSVLP
jgi:hypothetical protein